MTEIGDSPHVTFKLGTGESKSDREMLKKKKDQYEKNWCKTGAKVLKKIEYLCGDSFPKKATQDGITVILHKKTPKSQVNAYLNEQTPLEIHLYLNRNDKTATMKELLIRMLTQSFIHQHYEFHFRIREQTLFEDILADELVTSKISFMVIGRKLGRANCAKALDEAVEQTIYRLSQKSSARQANGVHLLFFSGFSS